MFAQIWSWYTIQYYAKGEIKISGYEKDIDKLPDSNRTKCFFKGEEEEI